MYIALIPSWFYEVYMYSNRILDVHFLVAFEFKLTSIVEIKIHQTNKNVFTCSLTSSILQIFYFLAFHLNSIRAGWFQLSP